MNIKLGAILFTIMPVILGILVVLDIVSANQFAGSGKEIQIINNQITSLSLDNTIIEEKIASYSSFMAISDRASQLGLKTPLSSQYETLVPDQLPVAIRTPQ